MQRMRPNKSSKHPTAIAIVALLMTAVMLVSFVIALGEFNAPSSPENESEFVSSSEESSDPVSESSSVPAPPDDEYLYYDDLKFEELPFSNNSVVNGSLAIVKPGTQSFPIVSQEDIVRIGVVKSDVYGLSNMSLTLYKEAIENIDRFVVSFYDNVPRNGLIINKAYTSSDNISPNENLIDLTTGYSVQFSIYQSSYKFADEEFSYLRDQAFRYGVIQRYPEDKKEYTSFDASYTIYRYVGLAHSMYMNHYNFCLEEYVDKIRTEKIIEFNSNLEENIAYVIYYVPLDSALDTTYVPVPTGDDVTYSVSGDGGNGFIVTVRVAI